jgi:hypothetical protein
MRPKGMRRNRFFKLDYSMLSSYLGRWATVLVFAFIILIALGALFLREEDIAHMPITIGVYDLDSTAVHSKLEELAGFIREKGGGDICWVYIDGEGDPEGCDFYLMRSMRMAPYLDTGALHCSLIATVRGGKKYSRGVVVVEAGKEDFAKDEIKAIFTSPLSAAGFLSPYSALCDAGLEPPPSKGCIEFAGDEKRVVFGVLYGAYTFGGISLERFQHLLETGIIRSGELEIFLEGTPYPEMVLALDRSVDDRRHRRFRDRFMILVDRIPDTIRMELLSIGVSGFALPRPEDIEVIKSLSDKGGARPIGNALPGRDAGE